MQVEPQPGGTTRRGFLFGASAASVAATAPRAAATTLPATILPATTLWNLVAADVSAPFYGNVTLPLQRLQPGPGCAVRGALPFVEATEGTDVDVVVDNQLLTSLQLEIVGVAIGPRIAAGSVGAFRFTMPRAGTYLVAPARSPWSGGTESAQRAVDMAGIAGVVVSRPASGAQELWNGGPGFDREYVLLYEDFDERVLAAQASGSTEPHPRYEPNYFSVNGLSFPATAADADTRVVGNLGERVLLRLGNVGRMRQSIHFHGYHVQPLARNNVPELVWPAKDTLPVPSYETLDVLLVPPQRGVFPLHPHSLTAVTANGAYPYGQLTLIDIR